MIVFLDDQRQPKDVLAYTSWHNSPYNKEGILIAKSFDEFKAIIDEHLEDITILLLDHDLEPDQYTPVHYWDDYEKSEHYQNFTYHEGKTGVDCIKYYLLKYMNRYGNNPLCDLDVYIHSQNPIGANKIKSVIDSYTIINGNPDPTNNLRFNLYKYG